MKNVLPCLAIAFFLPGPLASLADAPRFHPKQPETFFVTPDVATTLAWSIDGTAPAGAQAYRVSDYSGAEKAAGDLSIQGRLATASVRLPRGYFEIAIGGQKFGVVSLEAFTGKTDEFFGIDAVLTWLERRAAMRRSMIASLKRCGIAIARERINWTALEPAPGKWNWNADDILDLRQAYAATGLPVLEMFHSGGPARKPQLFPLRSLYPQDLVLLSRSWPVIYDKFKSTWGGLEVWNEPEGPVYGAGLAADQYTVVVKAMRYTWEANQIHSPLGGGVLMGGDPGIFHRFCALNGLFPQIDFLSLHDYKPATKTEHLVSVYRAWLQSNGCAGMPLWLTESGWSWPKGGGRPPLAPDQESALEIAMKGVEAKACGIARYMPFCLAFYEEGGAKNFAMMGGDITPLRSMAAYAQSIRVLAGSRYVGDLHVDDPSVERARIFERDGKQVCVLYTDTIDKDRRVALPAKVGRAEGIDGRDLKVGQDGKVPVPDGMAYVWIDRTTPIEDTPAMDLLRASRTGYQRPAAASPIILQYLPNPQGITASSSRYIAAAEMRTHFPVRVRVHNLSTNAEKLFLDLTLPGSAAATDSRRITLEVPALGTAETEWTVDTGRSLITPEANPITITATRADGGVADRLAIPIQMEGELPELLDFFGKQRPLDIKDTKRWARNMTANGSMILDSASGDGLALSFQFHGGDRWAYPKFRVDPGTLAGATGFLVRARVSKPAELRMGAFTARGVYLTAEPLAPADRKWHVVFVPFGHFEPNQDKANQAANAADPAEITAVSVGLNDRSTDSTNEIDLSDLIVVGPKK